MTTTAGTSSSSRSPELALFGLSALGIGAVVVLELTGHAVPPELYVAATAALTGGAGLALPRRAAGELEAVVATAEAFVARLEAAAPAPQAAPTPPQEAATAAAGPDGAPTPPTAPQAPSTAPQGPTGPAAPPIVRSVP